MFGLAALLRSPAFPVLDLGPSWGDTVVVLGVASLAGFALGRTRIDSALAGRAGAAYGGIYIGASLVCRGLVEDRRPTRSHFLGATLAIAAGSIILGFSARSR